jgi:DNA-binding beta-propeller fold protein YncE
VKKGRIIYLVLFVIFGMAAKAQEKQPLKLLVTTPLPGFSGDFDHFGIDLKGKRLFLTAEDHKTVEVFDLMTGERIKSITGFAAPHAIVYLPEANNFIVTDGDDNSGMVELVSGKDYGILNKIKLSNGVDGAIFNPGNNYYYVESGGPEPKGSTHLINIIDTKTFKLVGDFTLPGNHSEAMAISRDGKKLYVNLTGPKEVGVVDLDKRKLIASWPIPDAETPNSMVLDEPNHRLFIATRKPAKFFVFNIDSGKVVTSLPCTGMNDDMWLDVPRKRIYVTGTDTTTVFEQRDADHYEHITEVPTGFRAKTSLLVPQLNRLYVAVSGKGKDDAKLAMQIYEIQP